MGVKESVEEKMEIEDSNKKVVLDDTVEELLETSSSDMSNSSIVDIVDNNDEDEVTFKRRKLTVNNDDSIVPDISPSVVANGAKTQGPLEELTAGTDEAVGSVSGENQEVRKDLFNDPEKIVDDNKASTENNQPLESDVEKSLDNEKSLEDVHSSDDQSNDGKCTEEFYYSSESEDDNDDAEYDDDDDKLSESDDDLPDNDDDKLAEANDSDSDTEEEIVKNMNEKVIVLGSRKPDSEPEDNENPTFWTSFVCHLVTLNIAEQNCEADEGQKTEQDEQMEIEEENIDTDDSNMLDIGGEEKGNEEKDKTKSKASPFFAWGCFVDSSGDTEKVKFVN